MFNFEPIHCHDAGRVITKLGDLVIIKVVLEDEVHIMIADSNKKPVQSVRYEFK